MLAGLKICTFPSAPPLPRQFPLLSPTSTVTVTSAAAAPSVVRVTVTILLRPPPPQARAIAPSHSHAGADEEATAASPLTGTCCCLLAALCRYLLHEFDGDSMESMPFIMFRLAHLRRFRPTDRDVAVLVLVGVTVLRQQLAQHVESSYVNGDLNDLNLNTRAASLTVARDSQACLHCHISRAISDENRSDNLQSLHTP